MSISSSIQRIYILGAGSMGSLAAHELKLAVSNNANPILLFKGKQRLNDFIAHDSELTVVRQKDENIFTSKSQLAAGWQPPMSQDETPAHIENLIIATKTYSTEAALSPYVGNLNQNSNVVILQNGMGMAQNLKSKFWPNSMNRPNFFQAISTHGAYKAKPNVIHHVGLGKLSIAYIPRSRETLSQEEMLLDGNLDNAPEIIKLLAQTENLNASYIPYKSLILVQMEKLIINACINPLTALLDCLNGDLLYGDRILLTMRKVIHEAVNCFKAEYAILKNIPEANSFLSEHRLLDSVLSVCKSTASNSSSMREDIKHLNPTEINWINGHITDLGYKYAISTPANSMLVAMVKNKLSIEQSLEQDSAKLTTRA